MTLRDSFVLFIITSHFFTYLSAMDQQPTHVFDLIAREHSASLNDTAENIPGYRPGIPIEEFVDNTVKRQLCLSPAEKFKRACSLLKAANPFTKNGAALDEDIRNDLNILVGPYTDKPKSLINFINHTVTASGRAQLCSNLLHPLTTFSDLEERRNKLLALQKSFNSLKKVLAEAANAEAGFLVFWDPSDLFSIEFQQATSASPLYSWAQELKPGALFTMGIAQKVWAAMQPQNYQSCKYLFEKMGIRTTPEPYTLESGALTVINAMQNVAQVPEPLAGLPQVCSYVLGAYQDVCLTRTMGNSLYERAHGLKGMQKKLIMLARFIEVISQSKEILDQIPEFYDLAQQLDIQKKPELQELITLLESSTFSGQASLASHWGNIKHAYYLMVKNKNYLVQAYAALGELDFYMATVRMQHDHPTQFTFPDFISQQKKPCLAALDYWNPLLEKETTQKNSVFIGVDDHSMQGQCRTMIVAGPNGTGKTTNTTLAFPLMVLMAQGMGVVPARYYCSIPIQKLCTLIKNETNIARGLSLFTNLSSRVSKIEKILEENKNDSILCALDETFAGGTDDDLAKASQYVLLKMIGKQLNTLCVATVHTPQSLELAHQYPHLFANYYATQDHQIKLGTGTLDNKEANVKTLALYMSPKFMKKVKKQLER